MYILDACEMNIEQHSWMRTNGQMSGCGRTVKQFGEKNHM